MEGFLKEYYGLEVTEIRLLEGYEDKTFRVNAQQGKYVLKVHKDVRGIKHRMAVESDYVTALAKALPYDFPVPIRSLNGNLLEHYNETSIRLLPFLEGEFLAEVRHTNLLIESLGTFMGSVARVGMNLQTDALPLSSDAWDLKHLPIHKQNSSAVANAKDRALINYFLLQYEQVVEPKRYSLRKCLIHNDFNDWNLLIQHGKISGVIDFGDMCHSWLINDLAVALPYVMAEKKDPLAAAGTVIAAFQKEFPLLPEELQLLYYLIAGRICMSLCNSALAKKRRPDSEYVSISEDLMRDLLHRWISISPEKAAMHFLSAAGLPLPPDRMDTEGYLKRRNSVIPRSLSLSYNRPIVMQRAAFQYMFNHRGDRFLDAYNNIMLVGHCHPKVVEATSSVLSRINTNTRYLYDEILDYSERLLGYFPPSLSRVFIVNSGSAATDLALRLSKAYTGKNKVLALEHGYHGNTLAGIEVSHYKHKEGESYPNTLVCPMPKIFGKGYPDDGTAGRHYAELCRTLLESHPKEVGAFIAESIMGCGGQVPLPQEFLSEVYNMVRRQGGVCISDEVQVGFGRLGSWNWGYEKYNVVPDLVILGKPMGNGHPIGAVVTTEEIASVFDAGPEFFSSFGGNPVSCAAGDAVLRVLEDEGLREHARATGDYLKKCFEDLGSNFSSIADVRGDGLFLGIELSDPMGRPNTQLARELKNRLREEHILIGTDGPDDNVLKIKPPLPFNTENCDELTSHMARILKKHNAS
ncbi:aminotransferase class III-fold pyridoxal phosphate-dependent enzyme [Robiginitalea aurantiaca]|uniref:Aminotransferase class III-fold pyridoxal phosphate-dependent enzyme n=1 Tax=Robiginitalea aurantiaca TaxID=3056915 RepID=A0ABT7WFF9_9FLAO|nr:aminotransferase class III-fold pyridoxal phosphate-dependent enzyme [Robiginitalea aurantiaca]MDM9631652.1 aminotransferase class III-fold pyridoxal phosphate-dependent enzyme [Robiginitalea aurantiaca]